MVKYPIKPVYYAAFKTCSLFCGSINLQFEEVACELTECMMGEIWGDYTGH